MEPTRPVTEGGVAGQPDAAREVVQPVSFAQARLWFLEQLAPGSALYVVSSALRIRASLDVGVLHRCLEEMVQRHETLRTTFRSEGGEAVQVIGPSASIALPVIDLARFAEAEREPEIHRILADEARVPFDLSRGPLLRVKLLRVAEQDATLLVTFHHIIADGWSVGIFFRELAVLYGAFGAGLPSPLPELPIQYADFAVWQRETLRGAALAEHLEYWKEHLRGAPLLLDLPSDRPRPSVQSFRGATHSFGLPRAQKDALHAVARQLSATPAMVLLAAYVVLVFRRSRQHDLVIGVAIANRTRSELEGLIGFFVNMLALRFDVDGAPTFADFVGRVRRVALGGYAHQDLPFDRLVDELAPERSLSHSPIVQVTFGFQDAPFPQSEEAGELPWNPPPVAGETAKFDLILHLTETPGGIQGAFEYSTDLFDRTTIESMSAEYAVLIAAATGAPGLPVTRLPLLSPDDRKRMLTRWNDTAREFPRDTCWHDLVVAQAERTPDTEAVVCGDVAITYRDLAARSHQLAHHLRTLGVGPEVRVGLCLPRSCQAAVGILGVLAAGGAYVALDPTNPRERLASLLEDAELRVIVTETVTAGNLPRLEGTVLVCLDRLGSTLAELPETPPATAVGPRNLAYMIYTSGSTGKPKGVLVEHRSLVNMCMAQVYDIGPGSRVLQFAPLSFDASVCEIACSLAGGATLVVPFDDEQLPGPELVELLRRQRVTTMIMAPSVLAALPADEQASLPLRLLAVAGEACPASLLKRWAAPGRRIVNAYGPTEATIWASAALDVDGSRPPPLGLPLANVRMYLLDEALEPVPVGVTGEVFIGGMGVARGYHRRPELTQSHFLPDPFVDDPEARLYRTGDLARRLPDGNLEFCGRVDDQIKLRGYRIELGEVEEALREHPLVGAAAVVCREAPPGRRELVAYLVEDHASLEGAERGEQLYAEVRREWRSIFDETHGEARSGAGTAWDTVGWKSSYTGGALSTEEVVEWADHSARGVLALRPQRVLEVGCGAGLILHRIAPSVEAYVGIDFSSVVLSQLAAEVRARGIPGVRLECRDAVDLAGLGEREFDVVVFNSVVQYFPSVEFLLNVLSSALGMLRDGGAIFLGDLRSLPHLKLHHASVQAHRAPPGSARRGILMAADRACALDQELVLHPDLFRSMSGRLPGATATKISLRRGKHPNEMTKFHYDVVIRKGSARRSAGTWARLDARDLADPIADLRRHLTETSSQVLCVEGLANQRLVRDLRTLAWLEEAGDGEAVEALRAELDKLRPFGVDPEDIVALGEALSYGVEVSFARSDAVGRFDAVFVRGDLALQEVVELGCESSPGDVALRDLANDPLAGRRERVLVQAVRAHAERRLPTYMVPAAFVRIDALPLTAHGKVDRKALIERGSPGLPSPGLAGSEATYRPPRNPVEEALAGIWATVLRLPRVGIHDNFFEIGGDSILSIQIVSHAQRWGIALTPRQIFQHQTIARLAAASGAGARAPEGIAAQGPVTGVAPLTPVQRFWLETEPRDPHHFNQSLLLEVREPLDPVALSRAVAELLVHHDALRLRLAGEGGGVHLVFADPDGAVPFERVDLSALSEGEQRSALQRVVASAQASLCLRAGPIVRVVLFELGRDAPARLLLVVHHLAVDAVSWSILLEDLWTGYGAAQRGVSVALPAKTTSFRAWAVQLCDYATSDAAHAELGFWVGQLGRARRAAARLPVDHDRGPNNGDSVRQATVSLSRHDTERLLREAPLAHHAQVEDFLLAALVNALAQWTKASTVLLDVEGHGREEVLPGIDLTRTVGWFTAIYPVVLEVGDVGTIQRQRGAIPSRGFGFGPLRYLRSDTREALQALPRAEICWNYLGQLDLALPRAAPFAPASDPIGPDRSPAAERTHLVEINAYVTGGQFHATFSFSENRHLPSTIERVGAAFIEGLRSILVSDRRSTSEDQYALSPLQEGILFHARSAPSDLVYVVQTTWTLEGDLDPDLLASALQDLVARHPVLRTSFAWEGIEAPTQIVHPQVVLPVVQQDLGGLSGEEQEREVLLRAKADRQRPFDLTTPPLLRVALLRVRRDTHHLIWTVHHVILDGWSMPILLEELFALYTARCTRRPPALEPAPPFRQYIDWLLRQDSARSASFWRRELGGFTSTTALGIDRVAPPGEGPRGGVVRTSLDSAASDALVSFAQQHKVTLGTVVYGAWALLLSRYSGEDDVLFGITVSGRSAPIPAIFQMVGLLINTLPVRVRVSQDARVDGFLAELQAHLVELREHEHSPLVEVMAKSDLPKGAPLFDSLVIVENYPLHPLREAPAAEDAGLPPGRLSIRHSDHYDDPAYPVNLLVAQRGAVHLEIGYDRRRFDDQAVARMIDHVVTLLAGIAQQPHSRLGDLSLVRTDERHRLLALGNATDASYPRDACLHHLFEAQAAATPDAPALLYEGSTTSYRDLRMRAEAVASRLRALGATTDAPVGIAAERSPNTVAAILGVLSAGCAYLPLDPAYPRDRLAFMIEDARSELVVVDARSAPRLPAHHRARVLLLDDLVLPCLKGGDLVGVGAADAPAYVIYTSGSTGRPKGVVGTHRGIVNRCAWMWRRYPFRSHEVSCQKTSLSFVDSIWEIFGPLLQGVPSVLLPEARTQDLRSFVRVLRDEAVSRLVVVPSLLRALLAISPDLGNELPALAIVTSSGEALSADLVTRFHEALPGRILLNLYGSSEVSADATCAEVREASAGTVPIGVPIANTQAYVLDIAGHPTPIGAAGELYIGGDGLALGYLHRPELTAERFVADPFSGRPSARLFRTGDRVRRRPSGELEYIGRIDDQVKIRGVRVELAEVRGALVDHPEVVDAAVVARPDERGDLRLVAYVVPAKDAGVDAPNLAAWLRVKLPAALVPAAFVRLEALPRLPNGKLDRRALPPPGELTGPSGYIAPRGPIEEEIAAVWSEVLGVERISVVAGFFDLGGHSLLLARVHDRLSSRFSRLTITDLLAYPTVASLARFLEGAGASEDPPDEAGDRARRRLRSVARRGSRGRARA